MKTRAAVLHEVGGRIEIEELDLDGPRDGEVLIRFTYAGLCHSDLHVRTGHLPVKLPFVLGHEGAGIIEEVGPSVTRAKVGDHVVCSFIPVCGTCRWCASGRQSLCDLGATNREGHLPGGRYPFSGPAGRYGAMCTLGTFSQYSVVHQSSVVPVDADLPLDKAALVGCGVPTGWGSAVYTADVQAGDTVIVVGTGGIGMNAVQGSRHCGARSVIAVDPLQYKQDLAVTFGATHAVSWLPEAHMLALELTNGNGADKAILTADLVTEEQISDAFRAIGKGGTVVVTGINSLDEMNIQLPAAELTLYRKSLRGSLFGDCNPTADIPMLLDYYRQGTLKLDELITGTYRLEEINRGYADLLAGRSLRGVIVHET